MWLTTSKNAPKELKKTARALAEALPDTVFMPRGETRLERLAERAKRAGEKTLLVLMAAEKEKKSSKQKESGQLFTIRSRHLVSGEDGEEEWSWDARTLVVQKMKTGARPFTLFGEDAYAVVAAKKAGEASGLIQFLGLQNHPLAEFDEEPLEVKLDAKKTKKKNEKSLKLSAGKEELLSLEYEWVE